jgi:hypothetical protein
MYGVDCGFGNHWYQQRVLDTHPNYLPRGFDAFFGCLVGMNTRYRRPRPLSIVAHLVAKEALSKYFSGTRHVRNVMDLMQDHTTIVDYGSNLFLLLSLIMRR